MKCVFLVCVDTVSFNSCVSLDSLVVYRSKAWLTLLQSKPLAFKHSQDLSQTSPAARIWLHWSYSPKVSQVHFQFLGLQPWSIWILDITYRETCELLLLFLPFSTCTLDSVSMNDDQWWYALYEGYIAHCKQSNLCAWKCCQFWCYLFIYVV